MEGDPQIIHFSRIFREINHPAIGIPPFQEYLFTYIQLYTYIYDHIRIINHTYISCQFFSYLCIEYV